MIKLWYTVQDKLNHLHWKFETFVKRQMLKFFLWKNGIAPVWLIAEVYCNYGGLNFKQQLVFSEMGYRFRSAGQRFDNVAYRLGYSRSKTVGIINRKCWEYVKGEGCVFRYGKKYGTNGRS